MVKLGARDRAQLVVFAYESGPSGPVRRPEGDYACLRSPTARPTSTGVAEKPPLV